MPYVRRFAGKVVVVKYGGNALAGGDEIRRAPRVCRGRRAHAVGRHAARRRPRWEVHRSAISWTRLGKIPEFRDGQRVTDAETLDIARMVLVGKVNRDIVGALNVHGPVAVGLSGEDAGLIRAEAARSQPSGTSAMSSRSILRSSIACSPKDSMPIIATIGSDETGQAYNINADAVAGAIAEALGSEKLVYLTDVTGVRSDREDPSSLVSRLSASDLDALIESGVVADGMIPKAAAAARAVRAGVTSAHILDGRVPHALLLEVFTASGVGTMVVAR
jgi:acetylglutamate kinase